MLHYIPSKINIYKESKMEKFFEATGLFVVACITIIVFGLLMSLPVMWLWNSCLVAAIPGVKTIGWLQAWGIMILFGILFKNSSSTSSSN